MNEIFKMLTLFSLLFIFCTPLLQAQDQECIGFESLENGAQYGTANDLVPGDELLTEANVPVSLEPFHYFDGTTGFFNVWVSNEPFLTFSGESQYVFPSNINLFFDFENLPETATSLCIDFVDGGGEENISVNGEPVLVLHEFADAPAEIAPGVTLELIQDNNTDFPAGTLCLTGEIHTLLLGGQELAIDNVCFETQPENCDIAEIETEFTGCDDAGNYELEIHVQSSNDINIPLEVYVEEESYGTFALADFPLALEGIPPVDDAETVLVTVCEVQSDEPCCIETEVAIEDCSTSNCIGFENLDGPAYGGAYGNEIGEEIYTESDIPVRLYEFQNFDWTTSFHELQVKHAEDYPEFSSAMGQFVRLDGISAIFNFGALSPPVETVSLDFYYEFGPVNVSANGAPITILPVLTDGFINIGPGVNMEISYDEDNPMMGTITFSGSIYTLLIGGNALQIDNICADPNCSIENLVVTASPCDEDNQFYIELDFEYAFVSDTFALWLNGNEASFHDYSDLPLTLGPYTGPINQELVFEVKDRENPDCQATAILDPIDCEGECVLYNPDYWEVECLGPEHYQVTVNFAYENVGDKFVLHSTGGYTESFSYENLPLTLELPNTGEFFDVLTICDQDNPECCIEVSYDIPCDTECEIWDMVAERTDCTPNGAYAIILDFNHENTSEYFELFVNGELYESFSYSDLPIQFGEFYGSEPIHLLVKDASGSCAEDLNFEAPPCFDECGIVEVFAEAHPCNDEGLFYVDLEFDSYNTGPLGYYVFGDGQIFGPFSYDEVFVTVGPFAGDGSTIYDFLVLDIANPACYGYYELGPISCGEPCGIYDLTVETLDCNNDGTYSIVIDFEVINPGNEFFEVFTENGALLGYYELNELPLTIEHFPPSSNLVDVIKVCINDQPNCCRFVEFEAPDCPGGECHIYDVVATPQPCTPNGIFYVDISFEFENVGNEGYKIQGNGTNYGTFSYNEPFPSIGPLTGDGETVYEFIVIDLQNPECRNFTEIEPINCNTSACEIYDLTVETLDCNNDGTYQIVIDFEVEHPGNDFFEVFTQNGALIGYYELGELPLTIEHFQPSGNPVDVIKVCINDQPDCCKYAEFEAPDCTGGECQILDIGIDPLECDGDGTYSLWLNLEYANTSNLGFDVFSGNEFIGFYHYDELPVTVEHFPQRTNSDYDIITVCDNDNPNCCKTIEFMGLDCIGQGDCHIYDVVATPQPCTDNGEFFVEISFEFDNVGNEGYKIVGNGNVYGAYSYDEPFPVLGPFSGDGELVYEFIVIDQQNEDCRDFDELGPIECGGNNCAIDNLEATPECNNDGTYDLVIDFDLLSPGNEQFEVFNSANDYLGAFFIADLPVTIENYAGTAVVETVFVCLNDIPECCFGTEFTTPNCSGECEIAEIAVDPQSCDGVNTYRLWLDFQHENTTGESFDVYSGDEFLGFYAYDELPVIVEHFPQRLNSDYDIITICDNDNPDCCKTIEFMGLDCSTDLCLEFEEYEGLEEPEILAMEGDSGLLIHQENGVDVTADEIYFANDDGYLQTVRVSTGPACDLPFEAAVGPRLYLEGAIRLDFSGFAVKPTFLTFDYAYCPGTDFINLAVNGNDPFYGFFAEAPEELNGIEVIVDPLNNTGTQGTVVLQGELEEVVIGGIPLQIDNICFNGLPEDEEVWPGDGNADNIAHHVDLLNIGLGFSSEGIQRDQQSISWEGIPAANWQAFFANGTNYKHADCNGDGLINALDKEVIVQNYGLTHGDAPEPEELPGTDLDPPIFVDFSDSEEWPSASNFEVPIMLGTAESPVEDIYGIAFTITVDPTLFNLEALAIEYPEENWFGSTNEDLLTIEKIYEEEGKLEIAITRTDQNNTSGFGPIARLVGIIDDIAGIRADTKVEISHIRAIDNEEDLVLLSRPAQNVRIVSKKPEDESTVGRIDLRKGTQIFPNPTKDMIEVRNKYNLPVKMLELFDAQGKPTGRKVANDYKLSLEGLPQGVYMLKYEVGDHIIYERIVKM